MRSRWNMVGAGFAVLLAGGSVFMRLTGSAATGIDLPGVLRAGEDALLVAQNDGASEKSAPKAAVKPKAPKPKAPATKPSPPAASGGGAPPAPAEGAVQPPVGASASAPVPQASADGVGEFQPVLHAQGAKIATCMDTIINQSSSVIDSAHTAISTWVSSAPNDNAFQSIVGLSYPNKLAPNAASIIFAAPVGPGRCEGETVQIYPTAQPCSVVQANLIKEGHTIATLQALPVVETKTGGRDILLPSAGGGCVIVATGLK
jgi:hypothetical protein